MGILLTCLLISLDYEHISSNALSSKLPVAIFIQSRDSTTLFFYNFYGRKCACFRKIISQHKAILGCKKKTNRISIYFETYLPNSNVNEIEENFETILTNKLQQVVWSPDQHSVDTHNSQHRQLLCRPEAIQRFILNQFCIGAILVHRYRQHIMDHRNM